MIKGARYWNDDYSYRIAQRGNALYYIYNKAYNNGVKSATSLWDKYQWKWKLEWCGPSQAALLFSIMFGYGAISKRCQVGRTKFQPEDIVGLWFHEKSNFGIMKSIDRDFDYEKDFPNYWMKFYPLMSEELFNIEGNFVEEMPTNGILVDHITKGNTVQMCLKEPGHYVGFGAYDTKTDEFIGYDTWPERTGDFRFKATYGDIIDTCIPAAIYYYKEML